MTLAMEMVGRGFETAIITDENAVARMVVRDCGIPVRHLAAEQLLDGNIEDAAVLVLDLPGETGGLLDRPATLKEISEYDRRGIAVVSLGHAVRDLTPFRAVIDLYPSNSIRAVNYFEGPDYLILRREFTAAGTGEVPQAGRILISLGGSDPFDLTRLALIAFQQLEVQLPLDVVLGSGYAGAAEALVDSPGGLNQEIRLHRDLSVDRMAELMRSCTLAVTAFGTTAYELMALGRPVLGFTHYRWQEESAEAFTALGAMRYLGCAERDPSLAEVAKVIGNTIADVPALRRIGERGAEVVDGHGAARVADLLEDFADESANRNLDCLYILAHPGDELFGCGGTLLKQIRSGQRVGVLVLGEGTASRYDGSEEAQVLADSRRQIKAALQRSMERLEVTLWYYCRFEDNRFDRHDLLEIVKYIETLIRRHRPKVVYTHNPGDLNIDHRRTFEATVTAVRPVAESSVRSLYSVEVPSSSEWGATLSAPAFLPNWFEDVTDVLAEKMEIAEEYAAELRDDGHPRSREGLRAGAEHWGRLAGLAAAEAFVLRRHVQ